MLRLGIGLLTLTPTVKGSRPQFATYLWRDLVVARGGRGATEMCLQTLVVVLFNVSLSGAFIVSICPCIKSGPLVNVPGVGALCRWMSQSCWLVVEVLAKSTNKCERRGCRGVPNSGCQSFHGPVAEHASGTHPPLRLRHCQNRS
uniref:Putative secreted protein n=1 Tax=Ixodes ricinus TaxID=34613 RepID=A0A147BBB1_IXORI